MAKSGRYAKITKQAEHKIKIILKESNQGWQTTKQIEELIEENSGIK